MINTFNPDTEFTTALENVARLNVYFGHQSVGYNIVDGILDIHNGKLNVVDRGKSDQSALKAPCFIHETIGRNFHPDEKMKDFTVKAASCSITPDIAVMKFCFVDIDRRSDPEKLAAEYIAMVTAFKKDHPGIALLHLTVPLTPTAGIKGMVKGLIKKAIGHEDSNIRRMKYNENIRKSFPPETIFDVATIESTYKNGKAKTAVHKKYTYQIMLDEYNLDEGHFNKPGRQFIAGELIKRLAKVPIPRLEPAHADSLKSK